MNHQRAQEVPILHCAVPYSFLFQCLKVHLANVFGVARQEHRESALL